MGEDTLARRLDAAYARLTRRAFVRRWASVIDEVEMTADERLMLLSLLLVECSARPRVARVVEWSTVGASRAFLPRELGARFRASRTLGVFQQRGPPFRKRAAVHAALTLLRARPGASTDRSIAARHWNGPSADQGRTLSYVRAMSLAEAHAIHLCTTHHQPGP